MTKSKSKGRYYYYFYVYDPTSERSMKPVFSLGRSEKALFQLSHWIENGYLPVELVNLGLKAEQLNKWREEIEMNNSSNNFLDCCSYKGYNKNRKRPQRQLESFSS